MTYVLSLGGSLIHPPSGIDVKFLQKFKLFIDKEIKLGHRFFIVTGGGQLCRDYNIAAEKFKVSIENKDYLGIATTRVNASLLKSIFHSQAYPEIIEDPRKQRDIRQKIILAGGFKPGNSTDYIAVSLAKTYRADLVINLTNVDYVYDKDPKFTDAKKIEKIKWLEYRKIIGDKWNSGLHTPFDPIASKLAQLNNIKVIILNGRKFKNLDNCLNDQNYQGTLISN
jgi:uridylate kinase